MDQYLRLLKETIDTGVMQQNRTGTPAKFIPGGKLKYFRDGFNPEMVDRISPKDVQLIGYDPHPAIDFEMAK